MRVLILSQGRLAAELLAAAHTIHPDTSGVDALDLAWNESFDSAEAKLRHYLERLGPEQEVLILTDIFGGTPFNVARSMVRPGRVEVVSGTNLPMVLRLCCLGASDLGLAELARWIAGKGRDSVAVASPPGDGGAAEGGGGERG